MVAAQRITPVIASFSMFSWISRRLPNISVMNSATKSGLIVG